LALQFRKAPCRHNDSLSPGTNQANGCVAWAHKSRR
jgi:hypothetical protein